MEKTPCDIHLYDSNEYKNCIKDIVYEKAQDEWIMLDPRFPNLKGLTPKRIDEFLENMEDMREYTEDYLQHVMVYDRDDIVSMCYDLGKQIEEKYLGKLHSKHSIFVTTPRGGHEVLSIFAYTNDLDKEQIPSYFRHIEKDEQEKIIEIINLPPETPSFILYQAPSKNEREEFEEAYEHIQKGNSPIIPDIWLQTMSNYFRNKIKTVFIIDDIVASGEQLQQAIGKIRRFFNIKVEIIPIVLAKRKDVEKELLMNRKEIEKTIYNTEIVGIREWYKARDFIEQQKRGYMTPKPELIEDYDKLITVRFPWGSPDGESDKILTTLYESRRGLERIERKQRRCSIEPDACELK